MGWAGTLQGEGYEYHLLVIGILVVLAKYGSGKVALDNLLHKNIK
ncbi:hypothetical protein ACNFU2_00620 [Chryseobacterium sp. PTM-20240506]|nr:MULTISPECIES: hypothetical protein [unclassified Chryseobacterium]MDQ1802944.1 hypothetical protein [Chryseobacterium sp. CKR4-1]